MKNPIFLLATTVALVCAMPAALATSPDQAAPQSARLLTALALIVPQPYEINVDNSIPTDTRLSWGEQGDWEQQLRHAAESAGLGVRFNVPAHSLLIFRLPRIHRVTVGLTAATVATPRDDAPLVTGANGSAWQTHIAAGGPMGLSSAIFRILPSDMVAANIKIVGLSDSQPVSWQVGSRRQALMEVVQAVHARAIVTPQNIRLEPTAAASDVEAAGGAHQRNSDSTVQNHNALSHQGGANSPGQMQRWSIGNGQSISAALKEWAQTAGWSVVWGLHDDWLAPHPTEFTGSFVDAVGAAINALAANGADIRADIYAGNHTIVIHPAGGEQTAGASTGDSN